MVISHSSIRVCIDCRLRESSRSCLVLFATSSYPPWPREQEYPRGLHIGVELSGSRLVTTSSSLTRLRNAYPSLIVLSTFPAHSRNRDKKNRNNYELVRVVRCTAKVKASIGQPQAERSHVCSPIKAPETPAAGEPMRVLPYSRWPFSKRLQGSQNVNDLRLASSR